MIYYLNMIIDAEIIRSEDGSDTLIHPTLGDSYHSTRGAVGEARHVYINAGFMEICKTHGSVRVFEMGFGSGLNAVLTYEEALKTGVTVHYTSVELYPLSLSTVDKLNYFNDNATLRDIFMRMHEAAWNEDVELSPNFILHKVEGSLLDTVLYPTYDLVYFDAFAPDTQCDLWSEAVFTQLHGAMSDGGILVTYCAKGDVKRGLRGAGFSVERLQGALGKRHMVRAIRLKILDF